MGNRPEALASALYKLVYGAADGQGRLKEAEGLKAFFLTIHPGRSMRSVN